MHKTSYLSERVDKPEFIVVEIPPKSSFTKLFARVKAYTIPIYKILEYEFIGIEKESNKRRAINICTNRRDKKDFNQTLKNHSEELEIRHKKAKGLSKINI